MNRFSAATVSMIFAVTTICGCGNQSGVHPDEATAGAPAAQANTEKANTKGPVKLLNVSYDPTRELWKNLNQVFIPIYEKETGQTLTIEQSHGGSGSQSRAIIDGMKADVATLSIWTDTDALRKNGLLKENWENAFPNRSLPYTSTVVFVVRKGNPKGIKDWSDIIQDGVSIITPNPQTSGNGRLSFLAAWGSVVLNGGTEEQAIEFLTKLYRNTPNLDTGARGATMTFAQKGIGDVHLGMESEAYLEVAESKGKLEIIYPSLSILHEPHIAVVDAVVDQNGTRAAAEAYLKFLYTPEGQEIIAKHFYRPTDPVIAAKNAGKFPEIRRFPITEIVANWDEAQSKFFASGAIFERIYSKKE
jgi:sulfate/thiosulfate transport system substrate-binding protein